MVTFEKLLKIIQDSSKTDYQKAADLHSAIASGATVSPIAAPKKRGRKPKVQVTNGEALVAAASAIADGARES